MIWWSFMLYLRSRRSAKNYQATCEWLVRFLLSFLLRAKFENIGIIIGLQYRLSSTKLRMDHITFGMLLLPAIRFAFYSGKMSQLFGNRQVQVKLSVHANLLPLDGWSQAFFEPLMIGRAIGALFTPDRQLVPGFCNPA